MTPKDPFSFSGGWADRLLSTGKVAASAAHLATRRLLGREGEQDGAIGEALAAELDRMKGMAMKVGQILSYFDGVLPEETHAALRVLQRGVTTLPPERVAGLVARGAGRRTRRALRPLRSRAGGGRLDRPGAPGRASRGCRWP